MRRHEHRIADRRNRECVKEQGDVWVSINSRKKKRGEKKLSGDNMVIWKNWNTGKPRNNINKYQ